MNFRFRIVVISVTSFYISPSMITLQGAGKKFHNVEAASFVAGHPCKL
jgi:hypothetical protein